MTLFIGTSIDKDLKGSGNLLMFGNLYVIINIKGGMILKKWKLGLNIFIGIILAVLLFPFFVLVSPVFLVIHCKEKKRKQKTKTHKGKIRNSSEKCFSLSYIAPTNPLPNDVFIARIAEFTCLQFHSVNDLSGKTRMRELVATEHPEKKARVLEFLQSHPIDELLCGERYMDAMDMNRWCLQFIFEDSSLNRSISGYGWTEQTSPYLSEMVRYIPEILSNEEQAEETFRRKLFEIQMKNM